ncbi:MAG: oxidase [Anaerocolumna sp.]|jgi:NADPH-dependent 2,4-dienoyl-CoA reductase/sulfur reductase-like enzyme|nr:oxidase [Anaerocolumna sp.]
MSKIIVIGANHAGTAALNTILDNYKGQEVIAFDSNNNISFLGCGMALWIGKQISGPEGLFYSTKEKLEEKGARVYMETIIDSIDFVERQVHAKGKDGTEYHESFDKLILATGSVPIVPNIEGKDLKNVQLVKLYQNAQDVIEKLKDDTIKDVVVVGAGYIGVELAEAFVRCGKSVSLLDFADTCLAGYYDPEFTELMKENLEKNGIKLGFHQTVQKFVGTDKVEKVITDKGEYKADMVIMAVGFKPNTTLGEGKINLFRNGAFIVDKKQETNIPGVYAIGDCATVYDNSVQDINYIALASNAVRSGIVAAHNACGKELESLGVQGSNGISIWGYNMLSTGLTLTKAKSMGIDAAITDIEDLQKPAFIEKNHKVKIRIVYDKGTRRIIGAQMASDYDISMGLHMFSLAIQEKVTIDRLKLLDLFFLPHFNQPYSYIALAALNAE